MKRLFFLITIIFPTILLAQNEPINEDWLKKDKSNFINLMDVILSENYAIDFYQKKIENLDTRANQKIGFGANRYEWVQYGGYISNWMTICTYNDSIFYCKISITSDDVEKMEILAQRDSLILKLLSQNWNRKSFNHNAGLFESFDYEYINKDLYSKFTDCVKIKLGELENNDVDSMLLKDYQILVSPFENYDFGYACYYAGTPPEGRTAIEKIKVNNPNLIRYIIRGYCPEGRIYGIEALLELVDKKQLELTLEDKMIIKKVLNLKIPINRCQGCMVSSILAKDLFNEKEYSKILKKNDIVLE
jgi:hypothetical protein